MRVVASATKYGVSEGDGINAASFRHGSHSSTTIPCNSVNCASGSTPTPAFWKPSWLSLPTETNY